MDDTPILKGSFQFTRFQEKEGIAGLSEYGLINGESFIKKESSVFDPSPDGWEQRPVQISKYQNGTEPIFRKRGCPLLFQILLPEVNRQTSAFCLLPGQRQRALGAITANDFQASFSYVEAISPFTAGKIKDRTWKCFLKENISVFSEHGGRFCCAVIGHGCLPTI
jgi:hypothetical protein